MAFEFLILADGEPAPDLVDLATSLQVEQSLGDSARYTLRLDVDLDDSGEFPLLVDDRLRPGAELAVLVEDGESSTCLVLGPVDRARVHIEGGGGGSWIEVMGGDRRVVMDRVHRTVVWRDRDSAIVSKLFADYGLDPDVADTHHNHADDSHTQNQSATDLAWVQRLARRNGCHFWLSYDVESVGDSYILGERAHFKPSPPRPDLGAGLIDLLPAGEPPRIEINLEDRTTQSMTSIDIEFDAERPTTIAGLRVAEADTEARQILVPAPPHIPLGPVTVQNFTGNTERSMFLASAGDPDELQTRATAALAETEWFVTATLRCSRYSLGGRVLQPHMLVDVVGLGARYSGLWFVTGVSHSIDTRNHWMNVELARNALGA